MTVAGYLIGSITSLFVHEVGHICAAGALGVQIKRVGITWWGPYIVREPGSTYANAIVSVAGPLANLLMAALFWSISPAMGLTNLALGLGNLVPTKTSDGLRFLRGLYLMWNSARSAPPAIISPAQD